MSGESGDTPLRLSAGGVRPPQRASLAPCLERQSSTGRLPWGVPTLALRCAQRCSVRAPLRPLNHSSESLYSTVMAKRNLLTLLLSDFPSDLPPRAVRQSSWAGINT